MDAIPKEGGNSVSGTWRAFGSTGNWQANNITPELSEFIREGDKLDYSWESNAAIGGPIRQNKLWYFAALRLSQTNTLVANTFFPDGTQADTGGHIAPNFTARLTYQLNDKNKLRGAFYRQSTNTERSTLGAGIQPEAALRTPVPFPWATQVKWVSTLTNRVLLEAGQSYNYPGYVFEYQEGLGPRDVQVQYLPSNLRTTATAILATYYTSPIYNTVGSISYVTGSHTVKAGISYEGGYQTARYHSHGDMSMITYLNAVPSTVGVRNTPLVKREDLNADLGIYAQDKWTVQRLTLTAGLRYDYFNASVPAQSAPAGQFVPERSTPEVACLPCWSNWSPRLGFAYDLFGNGKTAVKATVGKFLAAQALGLAGNVNPLQTQAETRNWRDLDGNGSALDANGLAQYAEIGPPRNVNFGLPSGATRLDPDTPRPTNWEESVSITHELMSGVSATAAYYHRTFHNISVTKNLATDPDLDYTPFTIVAPPHPELANGGGEVITMYNLNANKLGAVDSISTFSDGNRRVYDGFEFSVTARLPNSAFAFGGVTTDRTELDNCADLSNSNPEQPAVLPPGAAVPGALQVLRRIADSVRRLRERVVSGQARSQPGGQLHREQRDRRRAADRRRHADRQPRRSDDEVLRLRQSARSALRSSVPVGTEPRAGLRRGVQPPERLHRAHRQRELRLDLAPAADHRAGTPAPARRADRFLNCWMLNADC